jgi:hypothetical protein
MSIFKDDAMHVLEAMIERYRTIRDTGTESAVSHLLTDLRHYCDQHEIDFEDRLEGSLDVYLEEQEGVDNERSGLDYQDRWENRL